MIGMEETWPEHLAALIEVFDQVHRVLRDDGTLWLNYGDSYAFSGSTSGASALQDRHRARNVNTPRPRMRYDGFAPQELMQLATRLSLALGERGWLLRSEIVWHKTNPGPESVKNRPSCAHEKFFLFAKRGHQNGYFYDHVAVRQPLASGPSDVEKMRSGEDRQRPKETDDPRVQNNSATNLGRKKAVGTPELGANLRNVWSAATQSYPGAHFATFPTWIVEPCIKAGTSEHGVCSACGAPYERLVETGNGVNPQARSEKVHHRRLMNEIAEGVPVTTVGWGENCGCDASKIPATVLDPFGGAGTVGMVAHRLGRDAVLTESSMKYAHQSHDRLTDDSPMFARVTTDPPLPLPCGACGGRGWHDTDCPCSPMFADVMST